MSRREGRMTIPLASKPSSAVGVLQTHAFPLHPQESQFPELRDMAACTFGFNHASETPFPLFFRKESSTQQRGAVGFGVVFSLSPVVKDRL